MNQHTHSRHKESGASLVEYALLICLIGMLGITAVNMLGSSVTSKLSPAQNALYSSCGAEDAYWLCDGPGDCLCIGADGYTERAR